MMTQGRRGLALLLDLAVLLFAAATLLFFLLRLTGDPAVMLAGPDATPAQLTAIRHHYGLDRGLAVQYGEYLSRLARFDFGRSLADGSPALAKAIGALPATLALGAAAMTLTLAVAVPGGLWLGSTRRRHRARSVRAVLFVLHGFPGFVTALLLIQLFAIQLAWLPALGTGGVAAWILPVVSVASFQLPKLVRLIEANTAATMQASFVRTARANGASDAHILWREVAPNALTGAVALVGAQFAFLVTGLVIIETIFAWPGIGWLLVQSTVNLDFPVVQAITFLLVVLVFLINAASVAAQRGLDPRTRDAA